MRFPRKRGSTSVMVRVFIPKNDVTTGAGLTGLTNASTNLTVAYIRELSGTAVTYAGANLEAQTTIGTYQAPSSSSKLRFKEVDATSFPGLYELQFHDSATAFGTGDTSQNVTINIYEATTSALKIGPNAVLIPLVPWDYQDGVRMGLTALPNAAADAAGGLIISDAGGLDADAQRSDVAAILVDTGTTLDGRIPAALVSGRMDASVGAMAENVLTATAINADAITAAKLAADVTTELQAGLATAAALTTVEGKIDTIDTNVDSILVDTGTDLPASIDAIPTAAENAVAVMTPAFSTWEDAADVRSLAVAGMKATHKIAPSGATLQIFKNDNTTVKAEQALTTDATLEPVKEIGGATAP